MIAARGSARSTSRRTCTRLAHSPALARTRPHSPALARTRPHSPALARTRPHSPALARLHTHTHTYIQLRSPHHLSSWRSCSPCATHCHAAARPPRHRRAGNWLPDTIRYDTICYSPSAFRLAQPPCLPVSPLCRYRCWWGFGVDAAREARGGRVPEAECRSPVSAGDPFQHTLVGADTNTNRTHCAVGPILKSNTDPVSVFTAGLKTPEQHAHCQWCGKPQQKPGGARGGDREPAVGSAARRARGRRRAGGGGG